MDSDAEVLGFYIHQARGDGVTVAVYECRNDQVVLERAAGTWPEVYALASEYGVSDELISVDEQARAILDAA
ncbi:MULTISPECIES: hypothetical protein [Streptacidiphilus]|uniref:Uncharacterized protein n=1 Tax=Streptacidiphilus cavernicola TaxID=3342716 RepID=A0ABV6UWG3_9ACTN|nr:hypothetical protein [Streptacidiphilus jeojiense]